MPSSLLALAPKIIALADDRARELGRPIRVLDVGVGRGKYGLLLREYLGDRLELIDGVEAEPRYVIDAPWLDDLYRKVYVVDIVDLPLETPDYDLVLMVDVLEHLSEPDAADALNTFPCAVVICTPRDYFQNPEHVEYPFENHRSHWTAASIAAIRPIDREDVEALTAYAAVLVRCAPLPA